MKAIGLVKYIFNAACIKVRGTVSGFCAAAQGVIAPDFLIGHKRQILLELNNFGGIFSVIEAINEFA